MDAASGLDYLDLYLDPLADARGQHLRRHVQGVRPPARPGPNPLDRREQLRSPNTCSILIDATGIVPAVNQIELHPLLPQQELREVHAQLGIATEAWSPLGQGSLLDEPDRRRRLPTRTRKNASAGAD